VEAERERSDPEHIPDERTRRVRLHDFGPHDARKQFRVATIVDEDVPDDRRRRMHEDAGGAALRTGRRVRRKLRRHDDLAPRQPNALVTERHRGNGNGNAHAGAEAEDGTLEKSTARHPHAGDQCRTKGLRWSRCVGAVAIPFAIATAAAAAGWPPFLPAPERFSPSVVSSVERVWQAPTLTRSVRGEPVALDRDVYLAFVDMPALSAEAARHLGLARYDVEVIAPGWYRADDHDGARGIYRVLVHDGERRVILSWGSHAGRVLGTIRGRSLSVIDFAARGHETIPHLTAYVLIENRIAARLASVLAPLFGGVIDRKLTEGFRVTARVAEWAVADRARFCSWRRTLPSPEHDEQEPAALPACPHRQSREMSRR
jgi:hypothetical protein